LILSTPILSQSTFHPFSNSFGFSLEVGGAIPKTDYKIDELAITGRILVEYFFSSKSALAFGIRVLGGAGILRGQVFSNDIVYPPVPENFNTDIYFIGGGVLYALNIGRSVPYFSALVSYLSFNPLDLNGYKLPNNKYMIYDQSAVLYSLEAGIRFPFSEKWSLNLGANLNFSSTDYLDDVEAGNNNDAFFGIYAGISFYLGRDADTDNDGVEDDSDLCPDTPDGILVDEHGCSYIVPNFNKSLYDSSRDEFILDGIFSDGKMFCIQVEVDDNLENAEKLKNEIVALGYNADLFTMNYGSRNWYSVRIGYFSSFENAKMFKEKFIRSTNFKLK
jgi:hypothetical protein